jgi:hypothetical protein
MITPEQVQDVVQLRASVHALISKGVGDEYLLATYNGIVRRLDDRLPKIRQRSEGKTLKEESRNLVKQQRAGMGRKSGETPRPTSASGKRTA